MKADKVKAIAWLSMEMVRRYAPWLGDKPFYKAYEYAVLICDKVNPMTFIKDGIFQEAVAHKAIKAIFREREAITVKPQAITKTPSITAKYMLQFNPDEEPEVVTVTQHEDGWFQLTSVWTKEVFMYKNGICEGEDCILTEYKEK